MSNELSSRRADVGQAAGGLVLVLEDDEEVQSVITTILANAGYDFATASTAQAARERLPAGDVQVLLCDVLLPDGSGIDLAREALEAHPDLAVIMVSGADDPEVAAAALEVGAVGYLTKPFRANDIRIAVLQGLSHRARGRRQARVMRKLELGVGIDPVTGLADRSATIATLKNALANAVDDAQVGVLVVDCNRFRVVNNALGQAAGDELLTVIGSRLRTALREGDTVGRWGGNVFLVICTDVESADDLVVIARRIQVSVLEPIVVHERQVVVAVSVGMTLGRAGDSTADAMTQEASIALEQAKQMGGDGHRLFDPEMREHWRNRLSLEADVRGALERGEFSLFYQPIVDLGSGDLQAFEALLRWEHPEHGLVLPGRFIPFAEESSLIFDIGRWVIAEVCRQIAAWSSAPGRPDSLMVSANVSGREFCNPGFVDHVLAMVEQTGIEASSLGLEITEGVAIEGESAQSVIQSLQERGVRILLDDFGTGYSALSSIRRYAINVLKIDRAFVAGLDRDGGTALVEAIVRMGRSLGLRVVAEGIETPGQLAVLRSLGCGLGQGYLLDRPMPVSEATSLLDEQRGWRELVTDAGKPPVAPPPAPLDDADVVNLAEAARTLGVSTSTVRRWVDSGRLSSGRTPAGHRRLAREEVRAFKRRLRTTADVRRAGLPARPLPELSELLSLHGDDLYAAAAQRLYSHQGPGWFMSEPAAGPLREWGALLGRATAAGRYDRARAATAALMAHPDLSGTTLLERHGFLERFAEHVVEALERERPPNATIASARRLFRVLGEDLLDD